MFRAAFYYQDLTYYRGMMRWYVTTVAAEDVPVESEHDDYGDDGDLSMR